MERGPLLLAASIVAASIVVAAALVQGALDRGTSELERVGRSLAALEGIVKEAGGAPRESAPARSGPSDRERARRVSLRIDGAPTRGPAGAGRGARGSKASRSRSTPKTRGITTIWTGSGG